MRPQLAGLWRKNEERGRGCGESRFSCQPASSHVPIPLLYVDKVADRGRRDRRGTGEIPVPRRVKGNGSWLSSGGTAWVARGTPRLSRRYAHAQPPPLAPHSRGGG